MPSAPKFEWPQGEPQFEVMWRSVTEALSGNGIKNTGDFNVTSTATAMEISVAAGTMYYLGSSYSLGSAQTFTLSAADGTYDRWDTVYYNTDHTNSGASATAGVHTGTAAANPEPPDVSGDEMLLAVVYVPTGASDVADTNILNWRPQSESATLTASEISYDDSTGVYSVSTIDGALDELQEAAQATAYPFALGTDTDMDAAGTDLVDAGTTVWDTSATEVPQAQLGGPASSLSAYPLAPATDLNVNAYPFALGTDTDMDAAGTDLTDSTAGKTVWDTSAGYVPRGSLDDRRAATTVSSSTHTTADEEVILVDTATISADATITLASADATAGNVIAVVDLSGSAATYPITVDTEGSETIDTVTSKSISQDYSALTLVSNGTNWTTLTNAFAGVAIEDDAASVLSAGEGLDFGTALDVTDNGDSTVTVDANVAGKTVLSSGTFTHTGASATSTTVAGVTTDQTANLNVDVGVDSDPSFAAAYAFDYTWDYSWDDTNQEMDVVIDATWATDPGSSNDVVLDYEIYTIDDSVTQGVGTEDSGTEVVSPARSINFGSGLSVADDGDETVSVTPNVAGIPVAKLTTTDGTTNINQNVLFPWTASPITDSPFAYDGTNTPTRLDITESGTYEVHLTIGIGTGGTSRDSPNAFLYKNRSSAGTGGTQLKASGKSGYIRENDGHSESSLHLSWIGTLSAGDYIVIQMQSEANTGGRPCAPAETNLFAKQINRP